MRAVYESWRVKLLRALGLRRPSPPPEVRLRPELSLHAIFDLHYKDLGIPFEDFLGIWQDIARAFQSSPGQMRPTDRFGFELPYCRRFGMTDEDIDLSFALARWRKSGWTEKEDLRVGTVDDFVRLAAAKDRLPKPRSSEPTG